MFTDSNLSTNARTAGVISAKISAGISDVRDMRWLFQIFTILKRSIMNHERVQLTLPLFA